MLEAVEALAENGWTDEAKDSASRTLAIFNPEHNKHTVVDQQSLHIMMSCKRVFVCCLAALDTMPTSLNQVAASVSRAQTNGITKRYAISFLLRVLQCGTGSDAQCTFVCCIQIVIKIVAELKRRKYLVWFE